MTVVMCHCIEGIMGIAVMRRLANCTVLLTMIHVLFGCRERGIV